MPGHQAHEPYEHGHAGRHEQECCHCTSPPFSRPLVCGRLNGTSAGPLRTAVSSWATVHAVGRLQRPLEAEFLAQQVDHLLDSVARCAGVQRVRYVLPPGLPVTQDRFQMKDFLEAPLHWKHQRVCWNGCFLGGKPVPNWWLGDIAEQTDFPTPYCLWGRLPPPKATCR